MRRRSLLPLLVILMFLFPLLQAGNSPAKGLDGRQQSMVLVAAYTANGDLERLRPALGQALDAGLTINEIEEVLTHLYAYVGFPRSLNGLQVFMEVLEQRRARGITDVEGKAASPLPSTLDRDAYGARIRADLAGQKEIQPPSGVLAFAPVINTFLKEHLFADIFARDVLDRKARELCTIAALASLPGLGGQLQFHMGGAMNYGLSRAAAEQRAEETLAELHMEYLRDRHNHKMSGGEKRMAAVATILAMQPQMLLMDEPSTALDPRNRRTLIRVLRQRPETKLIASHDLDLVLEICSRVLLLADGRLAADGAAGEILRDRALLEENGLELPLCLAGVPDGI